MFAESFASLVVPRAIQLGIPLAEASRCCSVLGDFADERRALAYCVAYAWQHYASFKHALDALGLQPHNFARSILAIDVGCGPATAFVAFCEWLRQGDARSFDLRYVGIDRSSPMRRLAEMFSSNEILHQPILLEDLSRVESLDAAAMQCEVIVVLLSYVLHQEYMGDVQPIARLIQKLAGTRKPIWILVQDANRPICDAQNVEAWPDTRLRALLNDVEVLGYDSRIWYRILKR